MPIKATKILALDPGARELGVALFQDTDLLYYGIKTVNRRKTVQAVAREVGRIVSRLIARYQPVCNRKTQAARWLAVNNHQELS